jgi:hypothetical protein
MYNKINKNLKGVKMKTDFFKWYTEKEKEYNGLITPANAAKMIGISAQHLNRIIEMGRIKKHYFEKTPFIGISEVYEEIQRREAKEYSKEIHLEIIAPIYPNPEIKEWLRELGEKFKNVMGGPKEEERQKFLDSKLQDWKKTADPKRVKELNKRIKEITLGEYVSV